MFSNDYQERYGRFQHPIIAETLASHIQVTEEAINGCDKYCWGALVLALVTVSIYSHLYSIKVADVGVVG